MRDLVVGAAAPPTRSSGLPQVPGLPGLPAGTPVQPYGTNDGGGFRNILPPGQNGLRQPPTSATYIAACPPPETNCPNAPRPRQLRMYGDLVYATPGLTAADIAEVLQGRHLRRPGRATSSALLTPARRRDDRARQALRRAPHLRHDARRHDVRRRVRGRRGPPVLHGRAAQRRARPAARLRRRRGGQRAHGRDSVGARALHRGRPPAPVRPRRRGLRRRGRDAPGGRRRTTWPGSTPTSPRRASNPLKMPGEYAALGKPGGPEDWQVTDVVATATPRRRHLRQGRRRASSNPRSLSRSASKRFGRKRGTQRLDATFAPPRTPRRR